MSDIPAGAQQKIIAGLKNVLPRLLALQPLDTSKLLAGELVDIFLGSQAAVEGWVDSIADAILAGAIKTITISSKKPGLKLTWRWIDDTKVSKQFYVLFQIEGEAEGYETLVQETKDIVADFNKKQR